MMLKKLLFLFLAMVAIACVNAQTADEIVTKMYENMGGIKKWKSMKSRKVVAKIGMGRMELQGAIFEKYPNNQRIEIDFQGMQMVQAFDGETAWMINPAKGGLEPEKLPNASTEPLISQKFESDFIDYAEKGHMVELLGQTEIDTSTCFELKLTLKEGEVQYHYVDTETYLVAMSKMTSREGQAAGQEIKTFLGDYREIDGMQIPFRIESEANGQSIRRVNILSIALNLDLEDSFFAFPVTTKSEDMEENRGKDSKNKKNGNW